MAGIGAAGLAALVALAALGPSPAPPAPAIVGTVASGADPAPSSDAQHHGWPPHRPASEVMAPVSLSAPTRQAGPLTGATISVQGKIRIRAASIRIELETHDRHALATAVIDTANRDGGVRPLHAPSVDVALTIPTPRPIGWLWLVITAYDGAGARIGSMRRVVDIGAAGEPSRP